MHLQNPLVLGQVQLRRFSAVGDGMHVEVSAPSRADPLLTFREDEQSGLQVVIHLMNCDVVLPLAELKRAIATAEFEVRTEGFYDQRSSDA